jgi:phage tail-like protein
MSAQPQRRFRFATPAQWSTCLFDRVDRDAFDAQGNIQPIAPYEQTARLYATNGAHAPAVSPAGEILWHDDAGCLHRLTACDDEPEVSAAPFAIAHASRLVSMWSGLWVIGPERTSLERYEEDTLSRLSITDLPDGARVIDIASDGRDQLFALVKRGDVTQALRIGCSGHIVETVTFEGVAAATAFVFLRTAQRFVVMTGDECPQLYWFAATGGAALKSVVIGAMHPCFSATALGSDSRNRVFLGGVDGEELDGRPFILVFDGDGQPLDEIALDVRDARVTGVARTRDALLVTGPRGLLRYSIAKAVPDGTAAVRCMLVTPVMHSPGREDSRRWLRIEAGSDLPDGASLEISYASTADVAIRDRLTAIAGNAAILASLRIQRLLREPGIWAPSIVFRGSKAIAPEATSPPPRSAPLFDVHDPFVWVCITLSATAGGSLPSLNELSVLYPGNSLMENLPAIYRRAEAQPGNFLRSLVGVLESTTQGLDARIGSLASQIDPATAKGPWVDFIARWLGAPWDDALSDEQKKLILSRAGDLARTRGTREGLETLLDCLLPGSPPRYRITDATADIGFAVVGGGTCRGSVLPVLLGGRTQGSPELGANAVLGHMRLPCAGQVDDGVRQLVGFLRVDLAATSEERQAWAPWLPALIEDMVPITARLQLQWVGPLALRGNRLDGSLVLQGPPTPHLGSDAVTGVARLPERGSRITSTGADIGTRLQ